MSLADARRILERAHAREVARWAGTWCKGTPKTKGFILPVTPTPRELCCAVPHRTIARAFTPESWAASVKKLRASIKKKILTKRRQIAVLRAEISLLREEDQALRGGK